MEMNNNLSTKKIAVLILSVIVGFIATFLLAQRAECAFCPNFRCYDSASCGSDCFCVIGPGELGGQCYGIR